MADASTQISAPPRPLPPTGTVTFLFTDIEGSTTLVQALGAAGWAPLLERHRAILRAAVAGCEGVEIQTDGDSLFAVFERAPAAVSAAVAAQRTLASEPWPAGVAIRVRMGLHTGDGTLDGDGSYVGADVHRAARIANAGHGGQVLLSDATRALVAPSLPGTVSLLDLGEHRLKDLRGERLAQLRIDGLPAAFPPLRSLDARPNNLPTQLTSFIGREEELSEVAALLGRTRLLTLSGPGGTGKTRFSLQLAATTADRFPGGVWFVPVETITNPDLLAPAIARVLSIAVGSRPALDLVIEAIGDKRVLLVLDNFEQVVAAAPIVTTLLRACAELQVVVTSRAVLRVSGEQEFQMRGLPAPPDLARLSQIELENLPDELRHPALAALTQYEAVRLFIARASAVRPGFAITNDNAPAVAQICARLHGMPLAIELAAARTKLLSPDQILGRLEKQLTLLTAGSRDLPERQQTLRGAIAWSYDLLDASGRTLIERFSVFNGGWDLDAVEAIVAATGDPGTDCLDGLTALVDQSLVRRSDARDEPRFELFPTIREFAAEMLAKRGEADAVAEAHARYYLGLAEQAAPNLFGADQRVWLDRLERNHDNFRAALDWATVRPNPEIAVRLGFALWRFWQQRGYLAEGRSRLEPMDKARWQVEPRLEARLLEAIGGIAYWQADYPACAAWYDRALAIWHALGDRREIANALYNRAFTDVLLMMVGTDLTSAESADGWAVGLGRCHEALAIYRELGDRKGEGDILWALGGFSYFSGHPADAESIYQQALAIFVAVGHRTMEAWSRHMLTMAQSRIGKAAEARGNGLEALRIFHAAGDLAGISLVLEDLAAVATISDDLPRAARLRGAAQHFQASTGTALARYVEDLFELRNRPTPAQPLSSEDLARYAIEGARMSLDEVVSYALEPSPAG